MGFSECTIVSVVYSIVQPLLQRVLAKLYEDTLTPDLSGGYPGGMLTRMGARRFSGTSSISLKSPGASMRVNPIRARTFSGAQPAQPVRGNLRSLEAVVRLSP